MAPATNPTAPTTNNWTHPFGALDAQPANVAGAAAASPSRVAIVNSLLPTIIPSTDSPSSTAVNILLIFAIILAIAGSITIVWLWIRRRTRRDRVPQKQAWDDGNPFAKSMLSRPQLIMHMGATEEKTQDALLQEVPNVFRILGRPNVATKDGDVDEAIPEYQKATQ
ncbi:hypothetical protein MIND_01197500 [Mycena indigotica]|uniref:Uncharacterized protein n=1 Tax=Mycena indigotica TaxID=2126181 RepID=A0A8H6VT37_9AGAR|nr:uncharacterized protein MIND_01197500 [Mycena indigotica]KAF7292982.1 hypothetical protein MIND_01197500 [Mycena indigotica]